MIFKLILFSEPLIFTFQSQASFLGPHPSVHLMLVRLEVFLP